MKRIDADLLKAQAGYALQRLGVAGTAGLALLAASAAATAWQRMEQGPEHLQQRIAQARVQLRQPATTPAAPRSPRDFLAQLPGAHAVPGFIEDLHDGASRAGLRIERAEYRAPTLADGQVLRTQVVLPVSGRYPALGLWLSDLLADHPSLAIDELSLQRDAAAPGRLRARVVLSHYSRRAP